MNPMIITVADSHGNGTYKATIRNEDMTRVIGTATCTSGKDCAARAVVRKFFGDRHADTVVPSDPVHGRFAGAIARFAADPKRKQTFVYFEFQSCIPRRISSPPTNPLYLGS